MSVSRPKRVQRENPFVAAVIGWSDDLRKREAGKGGELVGYLAGGLGVRCYAPVRTTEDIDIFYGRGRLLVPPDLSFPIVHEGRSYALMYDHNYNPGIGLLHDGFAERAVRLAGHASDRFRLHVLHPVDMAISKLVRFQLHDRLDIVELAKTGTFSAGEFERLAQEALSGVIGDPTLVRFNVRDALDDMGPHFPAPAEGPAP